MPRSRAACGERKATGCPSTVSSPLSGETTPVMILESVLLPLPLANQRDDLAGANGQRAIGQRDDAAIALGNLGGREGEGHRSEEWTADSTD